MNRPIIAMTATLTLAAGIASAEDVALTGSQLETLLTGNTVYLAVPPGGPGGPDGGVAPVKYGADGSAAARLLAGMTLVGTWRMEGDHYCVDWENGPQNSCTRMVRNGDVITLVDIAAEESRGTVEMIRPGNPEGL